MRAASVLLVDDRPENLLALEAVLAPLACRLVMARSGDEALKALLQEDFAVILLDVQMPDLDGFEVAELIRARERTRVVPIIFVTAISKEPHHVFRGYSAGAVDYVFKPYDPAILRSKVEVFVELYERGQALAQSEALLRATFEDAPLGIARADADGRLRRVNPALCATFGRTESELVGLTLDELGPASQAGADDEQRADLLAGRTERYEVERRIAGRAGTSIPVQVSVSRAATAGAGRPDLILHVQDIRDRKRAERGREQLIREQAARGQAEASAARLRVGQAISDAALGARDVDELLRRLLDQLVAALDVERAAVVISDGEGGVVARAAAGVDTVVERHGRAPEDELLQRVIARAGPVVIADVPDSGVDASALGPAVTSLVAVPLGAGGDVTGSLMAGSLARRDFGAEAVDLLSLAADRASLAIARTRLHERERRIAHELQRSLLPKGLPAVPGVTLGARYEPGGAGTAVGGDWYDAIALPGGRVGLAIGDVVGRGVEAAATMGQMRSALRAFLMQDEDTGAMADRLNRFALGLEGSVMTTVVLAVLEPATGRLRYTNAGHLPPLVLDSDGGARYLDAEEPYPPLGVLETPRYPERVAQLEPGATLVLYTDGLVELPSEVLDVGLDRLREAARGADGEVEELCERLMASRAADGAAHADDVTLLVTRALELLGERVLVEVAGEPSALSAARDTLRRWLQEAGATESETHDVTMATNEACQNAIEHGYGLGRDIFEVELERSGGEVSVTVRDRGGWQTGESPDRGRGIDLMRALMDAVEVDPGPTGTVVALSRRLSGAQRRREALPGGDVRA